MDTKKLRQKILDLAIHGKLVPQDPNDEPASVLLERIRAEKERLIAEGKIKRSKKSATSDTSHYENVPQGWCGCLLGEICQIQSSKRVHKNDYVEKGVPFYRTTEIKELSEGKTISNCLFISDTQYSLIKEKYGVPHKGDILISAVGTIGITYVIPNEDHFYFKDGNLIWIGKSNSVNSDYLCMMLGHMVRNSNAISTSGSAYNALTIEKLTELEILLPPLTEQNRIIEELNKWYSAIEIIENGEVSLFDTIQNVKSKILNLAIHGKLVPQDPNDEPASELLNRINPKAVASCDNPHYGNIPFERPSNWVWAKLGDITNYGKCSTCSVDDINNESWILELEDIEKDTGRILVQHTKAEREIKGVRHSFSSGNILYSKLRTYLNKVLVAKEDGFCTTEIIPIECCDSVHPDYICNILRSKYFLDYTAQCGYGVKMPRLSTTDARKALIPLPPYKEQIRISEKIDVLMGSLNAIVETLV